MTIMSGSVCRRRTAIHNKWINRRGIGFCGDTKTDDFANSTELFPGTQSNAGKEMVRRGSHHKHPEIDGL
jgi:hypothetical protein